MSLLDQVSWKIPKNRSTFSSVHPARTRAHYYVWNMKWQCRERKRNAAEKRQLQKLLQEKCWSCRRLTLSPFEMLPPKRSNIESEMAVESRRKMEFTFIFSLKTSHGYGILDSRALTEFYTAKWRWNLKGR